MSLLALTLLAGWTYSGFAADPAPPRPPFVPRPTPAPVPRPPSPAPEEPPMAWHDSGTYPGQQVYGYLLPDGRIQPATPLRMRPKAGYTVPAATVPPPQPRPASVPWYPARAYCPTGRCPR